MENYTPLYVLGCVGVGSRGCLAHACDANSLSRCDSKFCLNCVESFADRRTGRVGAAPPRKRGWSIHTSSRGIAALYGSRVFAAKSKPHHYPNLPIRVCVIERGTIACLSSPGKGGTNMIEDERQQIQAAWIDVLLVANAGPDSERFARIKQIIKRGFDQGLKRRLTLIAVAPSCDVFVSRYDPMVHHEVGWEVLANIICGTKAAPIRPPILIFLFDDSEATAAVRGRIKADLGLEWFNEKTNRWE